MIRQLRALTFRLGEFFFRERRDEELNRELESHLQLHIEDNIRSGMNLEQARGEAIRKLGGLEYTTGLQLVSIFISSSTA